MGWTLMIGLTAFSLAALWRFGRLGLGSLQLLGAGLLVALAGYAWQGRPGLAGSPSEPPGRQSLPQTPFAELRRGFLGQFDTADRWLTIADSYHRSGKTEDAVKILRAGIRQHPRNSDIWIGLGNALVVHADGMMTQAAELAFRRASGLAPGNPAPRFFYGLALLQGGRIDDAAAVWRSVLAAAPSGASWRPIVAERVAILTQVQAMREAQPAGR